MSDKITVRVQELGESKGGKPKVKAGNLWYFLQTDRDTGYAKKPAVGQLIEAKIGSFQMGDPPKSYLTMDEWRPADSAPPQQADRTSVAANSPRPTAQPTPDSVSWTGLVGQGFISNVVGQAIAAKAITEPGQILAWFNAAKLALEGKQAPFADKLPSREPGSDDDRGGW